jgi:hypothetical protein
MNHDCVAHVYLTASKEYVLLVTSKEEGLYWEVINQVTVKLWNISYKIMLRGIGLKGPVTLNMKNL